MGSWLVEGEIQSGSAAMLSHEGRETLIDNVGLEIHQPESGVALFLPGRTTVNVVAGDRLSSWYAGSGTMRGLELSFGQRVRVAKHRAGIPEVDPIAGRLGTVAGISRDESTGRVVGYAIMIDDLERVWMVEPNDLAAV